MSKCHNNVSENHMYQNDNLHSDFFFSPLKVVMIHPQVNNKDRYRIKTNKKAR